MGNPLIIDVALANVPPGKEPFQPEDAYDFLETNLQDIETYQLDSRKAIAAAVDYTLLYVAGSISSLASVLWLAYEKFIAPRKRRPTDRGGIYVAPWRAGSAKGFLIGEEYRDREIFVGEFVATVTEILGDSEQEAATVRRVYELRQSGMWIRRK